MSNFRQVLTCITAVSVLLFLLGVAVSRAGVPGTITYQGRLTAASGEPADGDLDMVFRIYADSAGGAPLWTESHSAVGVEKGLFAVQLGSGTDIAGLFDGSQLWLSIEMVGEGESTERMPIVMVPYAYRSAVADSVANTSGNYVQTTGDVMTGGLQFEAGDGGNPEATVDLLSDHANLELRDNDTVTTKLWGQLYGGAYFYHRTDGNARIRMDALYSGGQILLQNLDEDTVVLFDAALQGNGSVRLPINAVDEQELLNEPGIAREKDLWFIEVPDTLPTNLIHSTIIAPSSGYIVAIGRGYMWMTGERHGSVEVGLTTSPDEWPSSYYITKMGVGREPDRGYDLVRRDAFSLERVWSVDSAEAITCYMKSRRRDLYAEMVAIHNASILLMYFPTSYGSVSTWVSEKDVNHFERATAVQVRDPSDKTAPAETAYKVDLRELEVRALRKRLAAEQAERQLREARDHQRNNER